MPVIIRSGRYTDTRDGKKYILVRYNSEFLIFQGDVTVSTKDFNDFFIMELAT